MTHPSRTISEGKGTPIWVADRPGDGFLIRQSRSTIRVTNVEARELANYLLTVLGD